MGTCAAISFWLSLASLHVTNVDMDPQQINPGMAVQCDQWIVGGYYNSQRAASGMAGWKGDWAMVGLVDGYGDFIDPYVAVYHDFGGVELVAAPLVIDQKLSGAIFAIGVKIGVKN